MPALQTLTSPGIHLDFSKNPEKLLNVAKKFPQDKILSAGVINGQKYLESRFE